MNENLLNIMQTSDDSKQLLFSALALARSKETDNHKKLLEFLNRPEFINRLDTPEDYRNTSTKILRVTRVVKVLSENDAPSAQSAYVGLTKSANFLENPARVDALIIYSANVRDRASDLVKFWDKYCQPEDGFSNLTVRALVKNGTESAMEVLVEKTADLNHPEEDKMYWLRNIFLPHRNDFLLLKSFEEMLRGKLNQDLRPYLVEIIFDYKPEWYRPHSRANPPDRAKLGFKEREQLNRLGKIALQIPDLTDEQKQAVENTLKEIGL